MGTTVAKGNLFLSTMHSEGLAGKTETFVRYGFTERFEAGFGYLWQQGIVRPLASYTWITEKNTHPSLTTGLMFDALGGGRQGVFASVAKAIPFTEGRSASLYVGGAKISNEDLARFIAGVNVPLMRGVNASVQYDGNHPNVGLVAAVGSIKGVPVQVGIVAAQGKEFGPLAAMNLPLVRRPTH